MMGMLLGQGKSVGSQGLAWSYHCSTRVRGLISKDIAPTRARQPKCDKLLVTPGSIGWGTDKSHPSPPPHPAGAWRRLETRVKQTLQDGGFQVGNRHLEKGGWSLLDT